MLAMGMRRRRQQDRPVLVAVPTPERLAKAGSDIELGDDKHGKVIMTVRDSPLEKVLARKKISKPQYDAGCKYRHHWHHAGLAAHYASLDPNRVFGAKGGGLLETERQVHHYRQYQSAVQHVGKDNARILDWVCCEEKPLEHVGLLLMGWGYRSGAIEAATGRLQGALSSLCALWGL